ncbi:hypothetical protein EB796_005097 [Bugula neritina]|uniref:Uncharacterized protein n=1 Tax=Bugula neritina TaxID=10212 RepID=A0A7J7KD59_BUGNE|nr:hypothetical protein EB796_005097 [Bugula neritina]
MYKDMGTNSLLVYIKLIISAGQSVTSSPCTSSRGWFWGPWNCCWFPNIHMAFSSHSCGDFGIGLLEDLHQEPGWNWMEQISVESYSFEVGYFQNQQYRIEVGMTLLAQLLYSIPVDHQLWPTLYRLPPMASSLSLSYHTPPSDDFASVGAMAMPRGLAVLAFVQYRVAGL